MDKEQELSNNKFQGLTAVEVWEKLYSKELDCKKNILEYIDIVKILKKEDASEDQIVDTYNYIYENIDNLNESVKPNTIMYLKNSLKSQLGKYVKEKDPKLVNHFIEFFKAAYPENNRRKDFTWVLMDISSITEEQVWTTLTYINRECLNNNLKLNYNQKQDIVKVIEKVVSKNNIKFINNVKSLSHLTNILRISIVSVGKDFRVKCY